MRKGLESDPELARSRPGPRPFFEGRGGGGGGGEKSTKPSKLRPWEATRQDDPHVLNRSKVQAERTSEGPPSCLTPHSHVAWNSEVSRRRSKSSRSRKFWTCCHRNLSIHREQALKTQCIAITLSQNVHCSCELQKAFRRHSWPLLEKP